MVNTDSFLPMLSNSWAPTLNQDGKLNATVPTTQTYVVFEGEQ